MGELVPGALPHVNNQSCIGLTLDGACPLRLSGPLQFHWCTLTRWPCQAFEFATGPEKKRMKELLRTWNNFNIIRKVLKMILFPSKGSDQLLCYKPWINEIRKVDWVIYTVKTGKNNWVAYKLKRVHLTR